MNNLIMRLIAIFGSPKTPDANRFFREYSKATDGNSAEVLERGGDILLRTHSYQTWPTIAECVAACSLAARELAGLSAHQPDEPQDDKPRREKTPEEAKRILAKLEGFREFMANQTNDSVAETRQWKGRTYFGVTREDFEGRYSTVLGCRWHSPTLAEHIAKQDAEKRQENDE